MNRRETVRKVLLGTLLGLSLLLLAASLTGILAVWFANPPLKREAAARLTNLDDELAQAQTAVQTAKMELERTLRIVATAEQTLATLKNELALAKELFGDVNGTLDQRLLPSLEASRNTINEAKSTLQDLRTSLEQVNALPFINFNLPGDQLLADLIATADSIDGQITQVADLAQKASTFAKDASYLMGGDLSETKQHLQNFLAVVTEYDQKLSGWRAQIAALLTALPGWIDSASIFLTIFLLWFGFSQVSLFLHALTAWRGGDPLAVLRKPAVAEVEI